MKQELNRYLDRSSADPNLVVRLSRLRRGDATWTVLSAPAWSTEIRSALAVINSELAAELKDGDAFQFGIHYGRHVEFEYEITTNFGVASRSMSDTLAHSLVGPEKGLALLPPIDMSTDNKTPAWVRQGFDDPIQRMAGGSIGSRQEYDFSMNEELSSIRKVVQRISTSLHSAHDGSGHGSDLKGLQEGRSSLP